MAIPLPVLGAGLEIGKALIERFFPDPEKKAAAELEMLKMLQAGDLQQVLGQLQINMQEAAHESIFVAGWRPFVGWICGGGLLYAAMLHNVLAWVASIYSFPAPPPVDTETLLYVLLGMLGIGGMRSFDKSRVKTSTERIAAGVTK